MPSFPARTLEFFARDVLFHTQMTVFAVFISFVIRAVFQTIYALSNGLNTFNPAFSPCDVEKQNIYVVINAVLTCVHAPLSPLCCLDTSFRADTGPKRGFL